MATQDFKRKLTAIFSADVEGYSRLMAEDEETTVRTITTYREVMTTLIQQHRGKVVDSPGDNVLAEFTSVVDAVQCAVAVQKEISARNTELPENRQMQFRIGINIGDVIQEGDRIYGDGVNIAARLEGLAEPGGICISKTAFDHIETKLPYGYDFIGEQTVKNIPKPVGAYRVLMDPRVTVKGKLEEEKPAPARRTPILVGIAVVLVLAIIVGIWQFYMRRLSVEPASVEKMAFPLPDKPSIAVLPFDNLSGDSQQDYFSDGITESIITALSNVSNLFVIARNSTFTYKGKPVKMQQVAQELGVRYVLEGSVQRSGNQVRITAQLNDALKGHHLWAEKYDRKIGEIFALQDEITERVATALEVKLTEGEQARMWRRKADNPKAYEYFLRGLEIYRSFTKEDNAQARKLWEKAAELDPNYAQAWLQIGWTHYRDGRFGWTDTPAKSISQAEDLAQKTLTLDDSMPEAYSLLSVVFMARRQNDKAVAYGEKALALAPNLADLTATIGVTYLYSGRPEEAIELVKKAMRLSPYYPAWYLPVLGLAYRLTGQYEEAIATMEKWPPRDPRSMLPHMILAFTYVEAGRKEDAHAAVAEVLKRNPKASIKGYAKMIPYKDPAEIERVLESLRKAGLPE